MEHAFLNFSDFLQKLDEKSVEEIMATPKPKDGKWENPYSYVFNVEGDDCGKEYCYKVKFDDLPNIGAKGDGVMVSFTRDDMMSDQRRGVGFKVFDAVRKAIAEYVNQKKPGKIIWAPVERSSKPGLANNVDARSTAYEIWAIKSIWPNMYVSFRPNEWIRRDIYDKVYAGKGYPVVPADAKTGDRASLNRFRDEYANIKMGKQIQPVATKPVTPVKSPTVKSDDSFDLEIMDIGEARKVKSRLPSKEEIVRRLFPQMIL